jgi:Cu/Zn superoxide dismutase
MPGDMGNLDCGADGKCVLCFAGENAALNNGCSQIKILEQEKMSLKDYILSIVGRSVAIHAREDSTTGITKNFGLGDAGKAIAYGTVGIVAPGVALPGSTASSNKTDFNNAMTPTRPQPDKAVCMFHADIGNGLNKDIFGKAIVVVDLAKKLEGETKDVCAMRVEMYGVPAGPHSFQFHDNGDMRFSVSYPILDVIFEQPLTLFIFISVTFDYFSVSRRPTQN